MQGQALDYDGQSLPTSKQGTLATKAGGKTPEKAGAAEAPPKTNKNDVNSFFDLVKQYQQIAEENGWEPSTGPNSPPKAPEPKLIVKRRQKNGTLVNFNIDKSKPFVDSKDEQGNTIRIYET